MQIAYVNIFVSNLDASISFFTATLGMTLLHSSNEHGYAAFDAGPVQLGLAVAGADQVDLVGRHTGVGFATSDLEADHARLTKAGVRFPMPPTRQPWGGFMAVFEDPDQNRFYLDQVAAKPI